MKYLIDTNSLHALIKYYHLFDSDKVLYNWIQDLYKNKELIILEKIHEECRNLDKGIILKKLNFIKKYITRHNNTISKKVTTLK